MSKLTQTLALSGITLAMLGPGPLLAATFTVTSTADSGAGSLRTALTSANAAAGADTIAFNIPGAGIRTIVVLSALPTVTDTVTIDGTTQPGYAGVPVVELDGIVSGSSAFRFASSGNTLQGLTINRFSAGVLLVGSGGNTIQGCYIGTDATGVLARGNGVGITVSSSNNTLGGVTAGARNVISGNTGDGIVVTAGASGNLILGNFIGTTAAGTTPLGNGDAGIHLIGGPLTVVGGAVTGAGNVIAGNGSHGVYLENGAGFATLYGNSIGTNPTGTLPLGNAGSGVFIEDTSDTRVGGVATGQANRIAYNGAPGVVVIGATSLRNTVRGNSSNQNIGRGIDLGNDGNTANDLFDPDTGPNTLQNKPDINAVLNLVSTTLIQGTMSSTPSSTFTVDLYRSPSCLPAILGEDDKMYLGTATATTTFLGLGTYSLTVPFALPVLSGVTAVATDALGNSSEPNICTTVL
ncbi:right-handed parallel beta-helix repeat-containing protein [Corallococcus terminator]|uniref:Uncharacterized protein n=1 Tax=Corallococcus terminator TaxID=2316733 RepID=A0A3A8J3Q6_9BACT|nr:right-handed parallel beta-helix repeat-containing protein [Corallococcus terminator]RKG89496.1 hypothetical protein D7V88_12515 [Corallococcus terminator]